MSESDRFSKDPTCGMTVEKSTALPAVRDGETYYFCSEICLAKFQAISAGTARTCDG